LNAAATTHPTRSCVRARPKPKKKGTKISTADDLTKTSKRGDIELEEEELERVSGGWPPFHVSSLERLGDLWRRRIPGLYICLKKEEPTMSTDKPVPDKVDPKSEETKIFPDDLTKTSKSGDIELDEEELKRTTGGQAIKY
jgi:hypothetical protein